MSLPILQQFGQFTSSGTLINLDMGFVPDYFLANAESSAALAVCQVEWFKTAGSGNSLSSVGTGTLTYTAGTGIAIWQPAGSAAVPSRWTALTAYAVGQVVRPVGLTSTGVVAGVSNLPLFKCTTAGTTAAAEPTWPALIGGTVTDGTVVWTQIDPKTQNAAESEMLTGLTGVNPDGTTSSPAKTGLGITIPAALQTNGVVYDWFATARTAT